MRFLDVFMNNEHETFIITKQPENLLGTCMNIGIQCTLGRKCESVGTLADAELVDGLHEELIDGAAS